MRKAIKVPKGHRFEEWTVVKEAEKSKGGARRFLCVCSCGSEKTVLLSTLRNGKSKRCSSCGTVKRNTTHGLKYHPLYGTWKGMKDRCYNNRNISFPSYGGRGIKICDRWLNSPENFINDMGIKPTNDHSVERIDNDGIYEPSNCKWGTSLEQSINQRTRKNNTSGFTGVTWSKKASKWYASIRIDGNKVHLGGFDNKEEAFDARKIAENERALRLERNLKGV